MERNRAAENSCDGRARGWWNRKTQIMQAAESCAKAGAKMLRGGSFSRRDCRHTIIQGMDKND